MKVWRTFLPVLLAATTIATVLLVWRQYGELVELRAVALNRDERAALQRRIWELEKLNRELRERRPKDDSAQPADQAPAGAASTPEFQIRGGRGDRGPPPLNNLRELLDKPEVQAMINLQQKAGITARYAPLFRQLNLAPEQAEKLTSLLAERGNTRQDVFAAAREQGIDPRSNPSAYRTLLADAQNQINHAIKAVVGESGYAQYQAFEQTLPQRAVVNDLQQRLSYSSTPLTPAQAEQLIQILARNAPPRPDAAAEPTVAANVAIVSAQRGPGPDAPGGGRGPDAGPVVMSFVTGGAGPGMIPGLPEGPIRIGGAPLVTDAAVAQAQSVLTPPQLSELQQLQQQQQAQQQLQQIFRDAMLPARPPGPGAAPPAQRPPPGGG